MASIWARIESTVPPLNPPRRPGTRRAPGAPPAAPRAPRPGGREGRDLAAHRVDRAAADPAAEAGHQADVGEPAGAVLAGPLGHHVDRQGGGGGGGPRGG